VFPSTRVACIYEYRNGTDQVTLYINEVEMAVSQFDAAGAIKIRLSALPSGKVECQAFSGGPSGKLNSSVAVPSATTKVGLVTKADTARFQSVLVISNP
jgi:hypothetical protein